MDIIAESLIIFKLIFSVGKNKKQMLLLKDYMQGR